MQRPTVGDFEGLKLAARYLVRHGRLVQEFVRQFAEPQHLVVFTDSDTRRLFEERAHHRSR